jgi:tape measure domain-containing protein
VKIGATSSGLDSGLGKAMSSLKGFGASVTSSIGSGVTALAGIGVTAATAGAALAGVAGIAGAAWGVGLAADLEKSTVAFSTLLGSAEKAKMVMADIQQFAAATPFETPELIDASRKLLAFGISAQKLIPTLTAVGDVSAGIGAPIGEIAEIFGKAKVQGRLFMEDIKQLTGRGIPVIQELAAQFKVAESDVRGLVESGSVDFGNLAKAFQSLTRDGGKFAGLMDAQSQTLSGKWSTLVDSIKLGLTDVGQAIIEGIDLKALTDEITRFSDYLRSGVGNLKPFFMSLGEAVWAVVDTLAVGGRRVGAFFASFGDGFSGLIPKAGDTRAFVLGAFESIGKGIAYMIDVLTVFGGRLLTDVAAPATNMAATVVAGFGRLSRTIATVSDGIAGLAEPLVNTLDLMALVSGGASRAIAQGARAMLNSLKAGSGSQALRDLADDADTFATTAKGAAASVSEFGRSLATVEIGSSMRPVEEFFEEVRSRTRSATAGVGGFERSLVDLGDEVSVFGRLQTEIRKVGETSTKSVSFMEGFRIKIVQIEQAAQRLQQTGQLRFTFFDRGQLATQEQVLAQYERQVQDLQRQIDRAVKQFGVVDFARMGVGDSLLLGLALAIGTGEELQKLRSQIQDYHKLVAEVEKLRQQTIIEPARARAFEILDQTQTPFERFRREVEDLQAVAQHGLTIELKTVLDRQGLTFAGLLERGGLAAAEAFAAHLDLAAPEVRLPGALEAGTAEAVSFTNRFLAQSGQGGSVQDRIEAALKRQEELEKRQHDRLTEIARILERKLNPVRPASGGP